jgi:Fe-S cluster biogenesis protein NfuA
MSNRTDEEIINEIKELIESHVKPAVAGHGGNIEFVSYNDGHLLLELQGACSGCAGSTMTLKMGVESMLTHFVPEVETVDAQNGYSEVDPFYTDPFMFDEWETIDIVEVDDEFDN